MRKGGRLVEDHSDIETASGPWQPNLNICGRCSAPMITPYCAHCGQKRAERLTVARPLKDLAQHVFSLDSVLGKTLFDLTRKPGFAIRRYIAGDRDSYLNPAKYAFLAATVYALTITVLGVDVRPVQFQDQDPRALASMRLVLGLVGYLIFVYMVPVAVVMRRCFRSSGFNFAETYVALLFFSGHYMFVLAMAAALGVFSQPWGFMFVRTLGFLVLLAFTSQLYGEPKGRTLMKTIVVYALIFLGGAISGMGVVLFAYWWTAGAFFAQA